jgi:hypothetical protein
MKVDFEKQQQHTEHSHKNLFQRSLMSDMTSNANNLTVPSQELNAAAENTEGNAEAYDEEEIESMNQMCEREGDDKSNDEKVGHKAKDVAAEETNLFHDDKDDHGTPSSLSCFNGDDMETNNDMIAAMSNETPAEISICVKTAETDDEIRMAFNEKVDDSLRQSENQEAMTDTNLSLSNCGNVQMGNDCSDDKPTLAANETLDLSCCQTDDHKGKTDDTSSPILLNRISAEQEDDKFAARIAIAENKMADVELVPSAIHRIDKGHGGSKLAQLFSNSMADVELGNDSLNSCLATPSNERAGSDRIFRKGSGVVRVVTSEGRASARRAAEPGAEYVRQRAPGSMRWYVERRRSDAARRHTISQDQEQEQSSAESAALEIAVADSQWYTSKMSKTQRQWYIWGAIVTCVIAGLAVGLGVTIYSNKHGETINKFDAYTFDCSALTGQVNPHVLTQCHCNGNISTVANDITTRYNTLSQTFITTVFPDFEENIDSCDPRNQALVWLASGDGQPNSPTVRQRYSLALLFILFGGPDWKVQLHWLSSNNECSWFGVTCDNQNEITTLTLTRNNLTGSIPQETAFLTSLESLDLSDNQLQGGISSGVLNLTNLNFLNLDASQLSGTLPVGLSNLTALQTLQLSSNQFYGTIPTEYGSLRALQSVDLGQNTLTGLLPTQIGLWTAVELLSLEQNNLTQSPLPTEVGLLMNLNTLLLDSSGMRGSIPTQLFNIGTRLTSLDLNSNLFSGTLPTQLGQAVNMGTLRWRSGLAFEKQL